MSAAVDRIRQGTVKRTTGETEIELTLDLDGSGACTIKTGVLFLDHMLDALCRHSGFDLRGRCIGDVAMDAHHTVEDVGIAFGLALKSAVGDRAGINRYGFAYAPLDESLARFVVDFSGRPFLEFVVIMPEPVIGVDFASSLVEEFWRAVAVNGGLTVHIDLIRARNAHHAAEAIFKAAALALRQASRITRDQTFVPSTKGMLA
jgi:imidazoleglycerol-phosphate dehydratase